MARPQGSGVVTWPQRKIVQQPLGSNFSTCLPCSGYGVMLWVVAPNRTVLVIDDNPSDSYFAELMLEHSAGVNEVLHAKDGLEGLKVVSAYERRRQLAPKAHAPLMILLDIDMPRMNGFEFLTAYGEFCNADPKVERANVVMLTAARDVSNRQRASAHGGVDGFLTKPFTGAHVGSIIASLERTAADKA
ncbi:MAG: CheY-like chemotaxis protein [Myxococcota bacterium]|jgi:CheY-like chemotaxis protein